MAQVRPDAVQYFRKKSMEIYGANRKVNAIREAKIPVRRGRLPAHGLMGENEELVVVVHGEHRLQQFFAIVSDTGFASMQNRAVKRNLHWPAGSCMPL
jgi:hypothetical protein